MSFASQRLALGEGRRRRRAATLPTSSVNKLCFSKAALTDGALLTAGVLRESKEACSICLDDIAPEERVAISSCRHEFCRRCVGELLARRGNNCPNCRGQIVEEVETMDIEREDGELPWQPEFQQEFLRAFALWGDAEGVSDEDDESNDGRQRGVPSSPQTERMMRDLFGSSSEEEQEDGDPYEDWVSARRAEMERALSSSRGRRPLGPIASRSFWMEAVGKYGADALQYAPPGMRDDPEMLRRAEYHTIVAQRLEYEGYDSSLMLYLVQLAELHARDQANQ